MAGQRRSLGQMIGMTKIENEGEDVNGYEDESGFHVFVNGKNYVHGREE